MANRHGIVIEIIGDEKSYLRSVESTLASNTKLDASFKQTGVSATLSADAQIRAAVRSSEAMRANAVALQQRAAALPGGSREQVAATLLAAEAQQKYARSIGVTTGHTQQFSKATREGERELSKAVRGSLAGAGVFGHLGRSLLLASSGFVAFEAGALIIERSIAGAEDLEKAQRSLQVAIEHTRGDVAKLTPEYLATAKAASEFGQSEAEALTGLARATVLTGNAAAAQRAYQEALVISKATGKDFNAVLVATSKGQEGITTSLRRYGILLDSTASGQEQFTQVMARFGGQAEANTTASERLDAAVANFEATLGTALLPTFERLSTRLTDWLEKTEKSGKLQRDVNEVVTAAGDVFHTLGAAIGFVDKVTGSFANTIKLLLALKVASVLAGWANSFKGLAAAEGLAAGGAVAGAAGGAAAGGVAARVAMYTGAGAAAGAAASRFSRLPKIGGPAIALAALSFSDPVEQAQDTGKIVKRGGKYYHIFTLNGKPLSLEISVVKGGFVPFSSGPFGQIDALARGGRSVRQDTIGGGGTIQQITNFQLSQQEQLLTARAALTRTTVDDVSAAKKIVARVKRLIDQGRLHGNQLIQALQAEASAVSVIWSAEDAAAQKRAAAAQAAADKIAAQIQNSIDPIQLEIGLARAEAFGKSTEGWLRKLKAAALAALRSGKLSQEQTLEALNQIISINQQLASQSHHRAAEFKQLKTRALTAGLGLTEAQRAELRARLSQYGPGGTAPRNGTGAYGYEIGKEGRPIHLQVNLDRKVLAESTTREQQRRHRRNSRQRRGPNAG